MENISADSTPLVEPTNFDLAVIEVVEYLISNMSQMKTAKLKPINKEDLLTSISIGSKVWPQMVNHQRHVSTKMGKQNEIVMNLKDKYWVDPDYIWNYPSQRSIFIVDGILSVNEPDIKYSGTRIPASAKLLKKEVIKLRNEATSLISINEHLTKENEMLKEDIDNLRLLIKKLKTDN